MRDDFISRWSRKKTASKAGTVGPTADAVPAPAGIQSPSPVVAPEIVAPPPLPPVESLTPESDFTPFMAKGVDESVKRQALKTLFQDPRFNVMDGLDTYIDDYSKPDPLPEGWLEKMNQVARLGEYRATVEPEAVAAPVTSETPALDPPADATPSVSEESAGALPVDTAAPESPPPEVPESEGNPPRNSGQMV